MAVVAAAEAMARTLAINDSEDNVPPAAVEPALAVEPAPPVAAAKPAPPLEAAAEPAPRLAFLTGFSAPLVVCENALLLNPISPDTITSDIKYRLRPPLLLPWSRSDLCHYLLMSYLYYY